MFLLREARLKVTNDSILGPLTKAAADAAVNCGLFAMGVALSLFELLPPRQKRGGG
jgi:hypothetical protein